jgi:S-adenosylmethionine hydrolase
MKAVVLSVCPDVTLIDIGHDVEPHDVLGAALELAACYRYFPLGTVFLVVVDPGVGSSRRGLAADTGDYRFVAPDNGVLTGVFRATPPKRVVELSQRKFARATVSRTFEGRDRFAPAAGWLAKGTAVMSFGRAITDYHLLEIPTPVVADGQISGEVLRVDRFGNLISNIDRASFERLANAGSITVRVGAHDVVRIVATYAEAPPDSLCALFGSTEDLEVAVNGGNAAERLGVGRGTPVLVCRT